MIDNIDQKILEELQKNAKQTTGTIARKTGIPTTTVHNRIKKMEREGIIKTYLPLLNYKKLGKELHVLISITAHSSADQSELASSIAALSCVERVLIVTGSQDLVAELRVQSVDKLNELVTTTLRALDGVDKTQTMLVLDEHQAGLPISST